jgi:quercetin dioxygenase-like cupin family protein
MRRLSFLLTNRLLVCIVQENLFTYSKEDACFEFHHFSSFSSWASQPVRAPVQRHSRALRIAQAMEPRSDGPDASVGEITFPPNSDSGEHVHGAIEIFYVITGELEHIVNGQSQILKPGMAGFVKPPDKVRHKVGAAGATAVVVWVPGAEGSRVVSRFTRQP